MHVVRCLSQFLITAAALTLTAVLNQPEKNEPMLVPTRLKVQSYRVRGASKRAIRHALRSQGPTDERGISRDAYTSWKIRWNWPRSAAETVDPELIAVSLEADIVIPRASRHFAATNEVWQRYQRSLVSHELRHFRFAVAASQRLASRYHAAADDGPLPIALIHRIAKEEVARARMEDRHYDMATDHGRSEGIRWAKTQGR